MRVFVYFNLHKKQFSVKALDGDQRGRVIAHLDQVDIINPTFKVSEAGRQRVIREQRKNVHAGVQGFYNPAISFDDMAQGRTLTSARYNPYTQPTFTDSDNRPIYIAAAARLQVNNKRPSITAARFSVI